MTEYWKSNPMHWCDVCRVWLQDNSTAKTNHERGRRHQENLAKKLKEMRQQGDAAKSEAKSLKANLKQIEAAAKKQYEADLKSMGTPSSFRFGASPAGDPGKWILDAASGYYYNELQRYYFDKASRWYYGGEPPDWTQNPPIPETARFDYEPSSNNEKKATGSGKSGSAVKYDKKAVKVSIPHHPLAGIGGHQMPTTGKIGGQKRLGSEGAGETKEASTDAKPKKKAKTSQDKKLSKEERDALAKREAARARVQQRTMKTFGLA
ncbi:hypothetical protein BSKO_07520 [Bryopsis sp. KO-2023]|nr:hypothetical protein BSKO_07520 [Bryopsis sp. KO-2023]